MAEIVTLQTPEIRRAAITVIRRWVEEDGGESVLEPAFLRLYGFDEAALEGLAREAGLGFALRDGRAVFSARAN